MNTEQFIRDAAARGWSKTMTRQALGMSTYKFWQLLSVMPPMQWVGKGLSLGNQLGNTNRRVSPAMLEALDRGRARRKREASHTWNGHTGTIEDLAAFAPVSARTIRRRMAAGMDLAAACSAPPSSTPHRLNISPADI